MLKHLLSMNKKNGNYISFAGKTYAINLEKFKEVCTPQTSDLGTREYEITQVYEADDTGDDFSLQSKVEHETKGAGNAQNDMIVYDVVKMLIVSLLENEKTEKEFHYDFGTAIALNTLISWGVIEEL